MYEVVNLRFEVDTHCHTIASGHAYSIIVENAQEAAKKGLKMIAITDHGPALAEGPPVLFWQYGCYTKAD